MRIPSVYFHSTSARKAKARRAKREATISQRSAFLSDRTNLLCRCACKTQFRCCALQKHTRKKYGMVRWGNTATSHARFASLRARVNNGPIGLADKSCVRARLVSFDLNATQFGRCEMVRRVEKNTSI